jgi:hypothetical protein
LVRPVTVAVVAPSVLANISPGLAMTEYPLMAEPPSLAGACQDTTAERSPGIAVTPVGAPGTVLAGGVAGLASSRVVVVSVGLASSRVVVVAVGLASSRVVVVSVGLASSRVVVAGDVV